MTETDILSRIHTMPPVDTEFVAGRWHKNRVSPKGFGFEAGILLKSLIAPHPTEKRFLIIGRARSGTTLLRRFLNGHSKIHCDGELLRYNALSPTQLLKNLAKRSPAQVYGCKFLSFQMVQVHRIKDPNRFLRTLCDQGVVLIHLERDTFLQTLSLAVAQARGQYHSILGAKPLKGKQTFPPEDFLQRLLWNKALLEYERAAFAGIPHLHLSYEQDLTGPEAQLQTVNRICDALDVAREEVDIPLKKVLPSDPAQILGNYDEIVEAVRAAGHSDLLPRDLT